MVDPVTIQMLRDISAIIGVMIALGYYVVNIRHQRETRQAQLFMQIANQTFNRQALRDSVDLLEMQWTDLQDFYSKYDSSVDRENIVKRFAAWYHFDQVGYLFKKGLIDRELAYAIFGGYYAPWHWQKFKPIIEHQREYQNMPGLAVYFEYLANELNKMNEEKGYSTKYRDDIGIYPDKL